ncbi:ATP-binding protein [Streptomyces sp. NPDC092296]|uniref:ATP-binding protein n=1 Tax=Streptomyces sp. NPDC092296 TaxID=3366012 RepID=UPI0037F43D52
MQTAMALIAAIGVAAGAAATAVLARARYLALRRAESSEARLARTMERIEEADARERALLAEIAHLAQERVPAAALALAHPGAPVPGPRDHRLRGSEAERALKAVLDACDAVVGEERDRVDAAARSAMRGATSKIQTLLYQIQSRLQELQHEYDDPRLLELDFRNELALRRTQATAVLCEAWPGLARADSPLAEVLLGAQSRVPGYGRIKVANHLREPRLAVAARAAEPLAIALAELLANATAYSHPETEVPVTLQQGNRSALVVVDDAGVGMDDDQLQRARRLLSAPQRVMLTELGNPPQAGFAVIGRLAAQYGFGCHVEPSPYGGMRAIVRVPDSLLTVLDAEQPLSALAPQPVRSAPAADAPAADQDAGSLPTRHRRRPRPQPEPAAATPEAPADRSPEQAGARWGALQHGTVSGRAAADPAAASAAAPVSNAAPAADVPAADIPAANIPAANIPAADVPAANTEGADE